MDLDKAIKERHSVRRFSTKRADWRDVIKAIDMARLVPLAGNIPTLKFILVDDKEKIQKLAEACQQDFVSQTDYIVVVCSFLEQVVRSYDERGKMYARQQAGSAIQNFSLKITELGLATCWVGAFADEEVKRILQIPENVDVEAILPVGYELGKAKQRLKSNLDAMLYFNVWKNKYMTGIKKVEAV